MFTSTPSALSTLTVASARAVVQSMVPFEVKASYVHAPGWSELALHAGRDALTYPSNFPAQVARLEFVQ